MGRRSAVLVAAVVAQVAISLVQFGIPALTFALRDGLGLGLPELGLAFAAIGIGPVFGLIPAGWLCDRLGAAPVLACGTVVGALGLGLAALAPSALWLDLAFLLSGLGSAAVPVAGMSALLRAFPPERRGLALGLRQMAVPLGGAIAAVLLPALAHAGGLRLALAVPAALVLATGLAFALAVRGDVPPAAAGPRARLRDLREHVPHGLPRLLLVAALYASALAGVLSFVTSAAADAGLGEHGAAVAFASMNVGAAVARIGWGLAADRGGGTRRVAVLVATGAVGAVACLALPVLLQLGVVAAALGAFAAALGVLGFNGLVYVLAGELAGPERAGAAVGFATTVVFGVSSGVVPLQAVVAEHAGFGALYAACAALALAGALLARGLPRPAPRTYGAAAPAPAR